MEPTDLNQEGFAHKQELRLRRETKPAERLEEAKGRMSDSFNVSMNLLRSLQMFRCSAHGHRREDTTTPEGCCLCLDFWVALAGQQVSKARPIAFFQKPEVAPVRLRTEKVMS